MTWLFLCGVIRTSGRPRLGLLHFHKYPRKSGTEDSTITSAWLPNTAKVFVLFVFFFPSSRFVFLIIFAQANVSFHSLRDTQWRMGGEVSLVWDFNFS